MLKAQTIQAWRNFDHDAPMPGPLCLKIYNKYVGLQGGLVGLFTM